MTFVSIGFIIFIGVLIHYYKKWQKRAAEHSEETEEENIVKEDHIHVCRKCGGKLRFIGAKQMAWCDVCDRYVGEGGMKYIQKEVTPRSLKTDFNKNIMIQRNRPSGTAIPRTLSSCKSRLFVELCTVDNILDDPHRPSFPSALSQERGGIVHPLSEPTFEPIPIVMARPATPIPVINIDQDQRREHARGPDDVAWDPVPPPPR